MDNLRRNAGAGRENQFLNLLAHASGHVGGEAAAKAFFYLFKIFSANEGNRKGARMNLDRKSVV
jgi:hypothetical protein